MLMVKRLTEGWTVAAVASAQDVTPKTVRKWRDRFAAEGATELRATHGSHSPRRSVSPLFRTVLFDSFRLLCVQMNEFATRLPFDPQQLVELRVYRLGVPMLRTLNEERHHPGRHRSHSLPV
jgi:hypothetical protein